MRHNDFWNRYLQKRKRERKRKRIKIITQFWKRYEIQFKVKTLLVIERGKATEKDDEWVTNSIFQLCMPKVAESKLQNNTDYKTYNATFFNKSYYFQLLKVQLIIPLRYTNSLSDKTMLGQYYLHWLYYWPILAYLP